MLRTIIKLNLRKVEKRVKENHGIPFLYDDTVVDLVVQRCSELERGARLVDALITNTLLPEIGREFLTRMMEGRPIDRVQVGAKGGEFTFEF
jgi:type VI secretion system protein VasG